MPWIQVKGCTILWGTYPSIKVGLDGSTKGTTELVGIGHNIARYNMKATRVHHGVSVMNFNWGDMIYILFGQVHSIPKVMTDDMK